MRTPDRRGTRRHHLTRQPDRLRHNGNCAPAGRGTNAMIDTRDEPTLRGAGRTEGHVGRVRLLIADDHEVVRQGLRAFLDLDPALEVVGDAADGAQAVRPIGTSSARLAPGYSACACSRNSTPPAVGSRMSAPQVPLPHPAVQGSRAGKTGLGRIGRQHTVVRSEASTQRMYSRNSPRLIRVHDEQDG